MRHLVAEIAGLREMRTRDTTSVVEALAAAGRRSWSQVEVDNGVGSADPSLRKLQEKDPELFLNTFYHGLWQWKRGKR